MSNILINDIGFTKQPLLVFDSLLVESHKPDLLEATRRHIKKMLLVCILSEGGHANEIQECSENEIEDRAKDILDKFHTINNREHVAACFFRLLSEDSMGWTRNPPWRPKIIEALDSLLSDTLYKEWKVNTALQAHEKVPLFIDIVKKQEKDFYGALESLTSLESINIHRQKLMASINNKTGQFLLKPFLPLNTDALLADIYNDVQDYLEQKDSMAVMDAYTDAKEKMDQVIEILKLSRTSYSHSISEALEKRLLVMVEEDFSGNKATRPASVILEAQGKKYPFHIVGGHVNIGVLVKTWAQVMHMKQS